MPEEIKQILLRLPIKIYEKVAKRAKKERRSVSQMLVIMLEEGSE